MALSFHRHIETVSRSQVNLLLAHLSLTVSPPMLPCLPSALWALHKCIHFQSPPRSSSAVPCVSGAWSLPATLAPLESFAPTCLDGPTAFALLFRMPSSSRTLCLPPVLQPSFASSHPAVRPSPSSTSLAVHASFRYTLIPPLPPSVSLSSILPAQPLPPPSQPNYSFPSPPIPFRPLSDLPPSVTSPPPARLSAPHLSPSLL